MNNNHSYYEHAAKQYFFDRDNKIDPAIKFCGKEYFSDDIAKYIDKIFYTTAGLVAAIILKKCGINLPKPLLDVIKSFE